MDNHKHPNDEQERDHPVLDENYKEETGAEITEPIRDEADRDDADLHNVYGWVSVALSIISFFIVPILFAGAGIIVGFIARNKEAPILGNTAIAIGIISILVRLFIVPLI